MIYCPAQIRRMLGPALILSFLCAGVLLEVDQASGQLTEPLEPLPGSHWAYDLLEALDVLGISTAWPADFRPVSLAAVLTELDRITRYGLSEEPLVANWARTLGKERGLRGFPAQEGGGGGKSRPGTPEGAFGKLDLRFGFDGEYRNGAVFLDPGTGESLNGWGAVTFRRSLSLSGRYVSDGRKRWKGFRAGGLTAGMGPLYLFLGREFPRAPTPAHASTVLGGTVPFDGILLTTDRPRRVPGLDWLLGPSSWRFMLAPWNGITEEGDGSWFGLGGFIGQPHPRLRVGLSRVARMGGRGQGEITARRILRTILLIQNEPGSWDDQKLEVSVRFRWGLGPVPIVSYLVMAQEDSPFYRDPGTVVGSRTAFLGSSGLWLLQYEYSAYGGKAQWCFWCQRVKNGRGVEDGRAAGRWYHHYRRWPYARRDIPVGDPLGGYGAGHSLSTQYWAKSGRFHSKITLFVQNREEGNLLYERWPGWRTGVSLEGTGRFGRKLFVTLGLTQAFGSEAARQGGVRISARWAAFRLPAG